MGGFKAFPEVGQPLYCVENSKEANIIVQTLQKRSHQNELLKILEKGDASDEIKKSIGKLTRLEKRRIKAGDKTLLFKRLGIAEDEDIDRIKKKFGIKADAEEENISSLLEGKSNIGRRRSRRKLAREQAVKDDLVDMIS